MNQDRRIWIKTKCYLWLSFFFCFFLLPKLSNKLQKKEKKWLIGWLARSFVAKIYINFYFNINFIKYMLYNLSVAFYNYGTWAQRMCTIIFLEIWNKKSRSLSLTLKHETLNMTVGRCLYWKCFLFTTFDHCKIKSQNWEMLLLNKTCRLCQFI